MKKTTEMLRTEVNEALVTNCDSHEAQQGKYGWHPCSWQTYRKLKLLNQLVLMAKRQEAAKERYDRKLPSNRVIRRRNKVKLDPPEPMPAPEEPVLFWRNRERKDMWKVEADYRAARYPVAEQKQVAHLHLLPAEIDALLMVAAERLNPKPAEVA